MDIRQLDEEEIFHVARELADPEVRSAYLDHVCAGDQTFRERIEALLNAHEGEKEFLSSSPEPVATVDKSPISEGPGHQIGYYRLMERIGEGGMGVVYVAEQREPVRRKVALKIIKPGMDTKEVIARFEAERQALALMDHPNIARVLDAGATESGRPYFVMELVRGIPITDYCDQNNLTPRERLELFLPVCQAIQHAHQKGVIHRDVKPTNVLVTLHDGRPVPKIIDFGVAKAINQQLTERTVYTRHLQMVGTPLYMSPEQAELSGLDVDTRTDIYSLGVLLYELLTGTTPFDKERLHRAAYDEVRRIIREEEPPKPSTRISTLGQTATAISAHRRSDPKRLSQLVRGDLDWIVMKALEKDRTRRYETTNALARDIQRHLHDEPVEARAPSTFYRLQKFLCRNKTTVTTASLIAVILVSAGAWNTWERSKGLANRLNMDLIRGLEAGDIPRAEKALESLVQRGHRGDPTTLRAQRQLALAYAKPEVDRLEDAVSLLKETHEIQCLVLGRRHVDTLATSQSLTDVADGCVGQVLECVYGRGASFPEGQRAVHLIRLAKECNPSLPYHWNLLAMSQYRCGQWEESRRSLIKSMEIDDPWPGQWLLLAMIHHRLGEMDNARDWYIAGCKWLADRRSSNKYLELLREEAASCFGMNLEDAIASVAESDELDFYSRMIEANPQIGLLYHRRAAAHGARENWSRAMADYAQAAEIDANQWRHWEAWMAILLFTGDRQAFDTIWRRAFDQFRDHPNAAHRMDLAVLRCLAPSGNVDWQKLRRLADHALSTGPQSGFLRCGRTIVVYRSGQVEEAVNLFEGPPNEDPKDYCLSMLFDAMSQWDAGHTDRARELLQKTRTWIQLHAPTPKGTGYFVHDRPVSWCFAQVALREAEALIDPAG